MYCACTVNVQYMYITSDFCVSNLACQCWFAEHIPLLGNIRTFNRGKVANDIMIYTYLPFKQRKNFHETWYKLHIIEDYLILVAFISYLPCPCHGKLF